MPNERAVSRSSLFLLAGGLIAAVILGAGYLLANRLTAVEGSSAIEPGSLIQVHLASGRIVVGTYRGGAEGFLILSEAGTAAIGEGEPPRVQPLSSEPFGMPDSVLLERSQIMLIGGVAPGSTLHTAYVATGDVRGAPSQQPTP